LESAYSNEAVVARAVVAVLSVAVEAHPHVPTTKQKGTVVWVLRRRLVVAAEAHPYDQRDEKTMKAERVLHPTAVAAAAAVVHPNVPT
jgi:hypothetical protein